MKPLILELKFKEDGRQVLYHAYKAALAKKTVIYDNVDNFNSFCKALMLLKAEEYITSNGGQND